jgi:hypothetical protein
MSLQKIGLGQATRSLIRAIAVALPNIITRKRPPLRSASFKRRCVWEFAFHMCNRQTARNGVGRKQRVTTALICIIGSHFAAIRNLSAERHVRWCESSSLPRSGASLTNLHGNGPTPPGGVAR